MGRAKITVIGAGNVGATAAQWAASKELGDVVLVDVVEGMPQGKALDLMETRPVDGFDVEITGANDYEATRGSDVIIVTAGLARKPGMSRDDLLAKNTEIVKTVVGRAAKVSPDAHIIAVTNPLDAMTYVCWKVSGFPKERVMGMAGILDSARFRCFVAMELGVSVKDVSAIVLGGHGDSMVPLPRCCSVGGVPLKHFLPEERIEAIVQRTRKAGGEIVGLLKTGSAYYSPSLAAVQMAEAILKDKKRIVTCAAYLDGEYGIRDCFVGVPVKLGAGGVEDVVVVDLTQEESAALKKSADAVRSLIAKLSL